MEVQLSNRLFEWLLASWVGHGTSPGACFPDLAGASGKQLTEEFVEVLRAAGGRSDLIDRVRQTNAIAPS